MKSKKKIIRIGIAGTLVLGAFVVWFYGHRDLNEWAEKLEGIRKEAKTAGIGFTLASETRGSAVLQENVEGFLGAFQLAAGEAEEAGGPVGLVQNEGIDELRASLSPYDAAIDAWMMASTFEQIDRRPRRDSWGEPDLSIAARFAGTLLLSDARVARSDGDFETWASRLGAVLNLSKLLRGFPEGSKQLSSAALMDLLSDEIGAALVQNGASAAISSWPAQNLSTEIGTEAFEYFVEVEAARGAFYLMLLESGTWISALKGSKIASGNGFPVHPNAAEANEAVWLSVHIKVLEAVKANRNEWAGLIDALPDTHELGSQAGKNAGVLVRAFSVQFAEVAGLWAEQEAKRRLVIVASKAFRYRIEFGRYPSSLPDLGTASIDPYSSKPFGYSSLGVGFQVYSVGADRLDSGGVSNDGLGKSSNSDDLGFRISDRPEDSRS